MTKKHAQKPLFRTLLGSFSFLFLIFCAVAPTFSETITGQIPGVTILDIGTNDAPSDWQIVNGAIIQKSNIWGGSETREDPVKPGTSLIWGQPDWTDYTLSMDIKSKDDDSFGFFLRYKDENTYYRVSLDKQRKVFRFIKKSGGFVSILGEKEAEYTIDKWYHVNAEIKGGQFKINLDHQMIFDVSDTATIPSGKTGLYCWGNQNSEFKNIQVTPVSGPPVFMIAKNNAESPLSTKSESPLPPPKTGSESENKNNSKEPVIFSAKNAVSLDISECEIVDEGRYDGPSSWYAFDGVLSQASNIWGGNASPDDREKPGTFAIIGKSGWNDHTLSVEFRSQDDGATGVMFRYKDKNNYYRFSMDHKNSYRRLAKKQDGRISILAEDSGNYRPEQWNTIKIEAIKENISVFLNDETVFSVTDNTHKSGKLALYCWGNDRVEFRSVKVATDGSSVAETSKSLDHKPIKKDPVKPVIEAKAPITTPPAPSPVVETKVPEEKAPVNKPMVAAPLSEEKVPVKPIAPIDKNVLDAGYEIIDEGTTDAPSAWTLKEGNLIQSSNIWGGQNEAKDPIKPGTFAIMKDKVWSDFSFSADLRSTDDDGMGIIFRYQDQNNYYRLVLDKQRGYRQIIKKVNGLISILAEDSVSYQTGRWYAIGIDAFKSDIRITVDNKPVFHVVDSGLPQGKMGFYSWGNQNSYFRNIKVEPLSGPKPKAVKAPDKVNDLLKKNAYPIDLKDPVIVDEGTSDLPSFWHVKDNILIQTSNIWGGSLSSDEPEKPGTIALFGKNSWDNYIVSLKLRSLDDDELGIVFRYQDKENYYRISMNSQFGYIRLLKKVNGKTTIIDQIKNTYEKEKWYLYQVSVIGNKISIRIDDTPIFDRTDDSFPSGKIGFYCWGNENGEFADILVVPGPSIAKPIVPAPSIAKTTVPGPSISKTAVPAPPIANTVVPGPSIAKTVVPPAPQKKEKTESLKKPLPVPVDLGKSSIVDDGKQNGPSAWSVANGIITQSTNVWGGNISEADPSQPGTYAVYGDIGMTNYELSLELNSGDDDSIGVLFRYQDEANHYRFSMNRQQKKRRLVKKVGGHVTILAENNDSYEIDRWYKVRARVHKDQLTVFVDDILIFDVRDSALGAGKIALYCWGNDKSRYKNLTIAQDPDKKSGPGKEDTPPKPSFSASPEKNLSVPVPLPPVMKEKESMEERAAQEKRLAEQKRYEEEAIKAEQIRRTETIKRAQEAKIAEEKRLAEQQKIEADIRKAEEEKRAAKLQQIQAMREAEMARQAEDARKAEEKRIFEEQEKKKAELKRAEENRLAEIKRKEDETRRAIDKARADGLKKEALKKAAIVQPVDIPLDKIEETLIDTQKSKYIIVDEGPKNGPSSWSETPDGVIQHSNIWGGDASRENIDKPGTYLLWGEEWKSYVADISIRSLDDDEIGILFRYRDTNNYYRFSMNSQFKYRRLIKKVDGKVTVLASDDFSYRQGQWYSIKIKAVQKNIEVFVDNSLVFSLTDISHKQGKIGLYSWANDHSEFKDISVLPVSAQPSASPKSSYESIDEGDKEGPSIWSSEDGVLIQKSKIWGGAISKESVLKRGTYAIWGETFFNHMIETDLKSGDNGSIGIMFRYQDRNNYYLFEMNREFNYRRLIKNVNGKGTVLAEEEFTYEINKWYKTKISVLKNDIQVYVDGRPVFAVKDYAIEYGKICFYSWKNQGSAFRDVSVVPIEDKSETPLSGIRSDYRIIDEGDLNNPLSIDPLFLFADASDAPPINLNDTSFRKRLTTEKACAGYTIVDEGANDGPSSWYIATDGVLLQTSNIYGEDDPENPVKPGTYALGGNTCCRNYKLSCDIRSQDDDSMGLMFRYANSKNYYRFSMNRQQKHRELSKIINGRCTVLAEDFIPYIQDQWYTVTIRVVDYTLEVYLDGLMIFDVIDSSLAKGGFGLYCWGNENTEFRNPYMTPLPEGRTEAPRAPAIAAPIEKKLPVVPRKVIPPPPMVEPTKEFSLIAHKSYTIVDEGTNNFPSSWSVIDGILKQSSNIWGGTLDKTDPDKPGTYLLWGDDYENYSVTGEMKSKDDDALGVMFRYQDGDNYYRFAMNRELHYRRLEKKMNGEYHILAQDEIPYEQNRWYSFQATATDDRIVIWIDGKQIFDVKDASLKKGKAGLYTWGNENSEFDNFLITPSSQKEAVQKTSASGNSPHNLDLDNYAIVDEGANSGPSAWSLENGILTQRSNIWGGTIDNASPEKPGTYALYGNYSWQNYGVSLDLRSEDDDGIGVMVRYQDKDNYYRISLNHQEKSRRIIKKRNGQTTILAEDKNTYTPNVWFNLKVVCIEDKFKFYQDGQLIFDITDPDLKTGKFGLYCWGNEGSEFKNISATPIQERHATE